MQVNSAGPAWAMVATMTTEPCRKFESLLEECRGLGAVAAAVAHPCDAQSLRGVVDATLAGLIWPILVGPAPRMRAAAARAGLDVSAFELVDTPHSHASAIEAVRLVREGRAEMLVKEIGRASCRERVCCKV